MTATKLRPTMRWIAKALLQKGLSALPGPERANYVFQHYVSRSLPVGEDIFRRRFRRAEEHLRAYEKHGSGMPVGEAVFYEFGAGWDLTLPLAFWSLGVERQILVDLRSNVRLPLVGRGLARLRRLAREDPRLRDPGPASVGSLDELADRFGIRYLAPCDARRTGLPASSVDFVSSTNTLEHVPADDLVPLLAECRRLLRVEGILSARIDLSDHFSRFDDSISPYNFLHYSDRGWRLFNSTLLYQSRLRRPDYERAFVGAGFAVVVAKSRTPRDADVMLASVRPATRFGGYVLDDLAALKLWVVARPPRADADAEGKEVAG